MSESVEKWKIRFGQIFQHYLRQEQKELADYFYFLPAGTTYDQHSPNAFKLMDLNQNPTLYQTHFSGEIPAVSELNNRQAERLNWTIVIVPGFGHHLLKEKTFQQQKPFLEDLGFRVIYAAYDDSFESNRACAERVIEIVNDEWDKSSPLVFLGYSKGAPVVMELLRIDAGASITAKTKALVSLAGAIRGAPAASSKSTKQITKLLKIFKKHEKLFSLPNRMMHKLVSVLAKTKIKFFTEWLHLIEKSQEFIDDLTDLPEGIENLSRLSCRNDFENLRLPDHINLFSLSTVYPQEEIKHPKNLDDLFLYVSGKELYDLHVFNDLQVLLPDSKFLPTNGAIVDLGILKMHHWGVAMRCVIGSGYAHSFPRDALIKTLFTLLVEFYHLNE